MTRLQWLTCWDRLRQTLNTRTTWGRNQIIEEMDKIERAMVREGEAGSPERDILTALKNVGVGINCGACVEVGFTGLTTANHTCKK